jgi:hypothetical protein
MSQEAQIIKMLRKGPITPLDAFRQVGCMRLAARIHDLKEKGFVIDSTFVRIGGKKVSRYRLIKER